MMESTVLLLDFDGVLNVRPTADALVPLAGRLGVSAALLARRFRTLRRAYDLGQPAGDYWAGVVGRPLTEDELHDAVQTDIDVWGEVDPCAVGATRRAAEAGWRLALPSNMPADVADAYEQRTWTEPFDVLLFSARLGLAKPTPAVFSAALAALDVDAASVVFLDDRTENVDAARSVGIDARVCVGGAALAVIVDRFLAG